MAFSILLAVASIAGADTCPAKFKTVHGIGLTEGGHFLTKYNVASPEACCAACVDYTGAGGPCTTYTYHPSGGVCTVAAAVSENPHSLPGTISGSTDNIPPPGPQPPSPPSPPSPPPSQACNTAPPAPRAKAGSPNIVLFLTDDMDLLLGGWTPMAKATHALSEQGATAKNWFIHTPVCCPSRAELLTGRYFHNIRVAKKGDPGCMSVNVTGSLDHPFYADWYFAPHLQQAGYTVGIFGKHLNGDNPTCPPPGVDRWFANGGGNYYSPEFSWASSGTVASSYKGTNCTYNDGSCYSTSVIGNTSLAWINEVLAEPEATRKPFFAYVAVKAPHIQDGPGWPITLPAPWYSPNDTSLFPGLKAPRTPNWNASCPDHHWLIRQQPPMTAEQEFHSDALYRNRWLALMSVDDLVDDFVTVLTNAGVVDNTYFLFTSDHGFRFGQYRMPEGKWNTYDNDLRIPMVVRGPGIKAGAVFEHIASNVDTMPTVLGLAGVATPASMDGRSLAHLLVTNVDAAPAPTRAHLETNAVRKAADAPWRSELLVEYYGLGDVVRYEHLEDTGNNTFRTLRIINPAAPPGLQNAKYVEFVGADNWDHVAAPEEYELFDLDADPWELKNIYSAASASVKTDLNQRVDKLYRCRGAATCN